MSEKPAFLSASSSGGKYECASRPQKMGVDEPNPDSIPAGGRILKADPSGPAANGPTGGVAGTNHKPFKLTGEQAAAPESTMNDAGSVGSTGGDSDI